MAILIPSPHLKHVKMTPGERSFAARLLTKLEDDYHCWFDVPVGRRQMRPDFIVLHPGRGILVLEVKDWKLPNIRHINAKTVELLTDRGIVHQPNPFEQARAYALEIKESLERDPFLVEQENKRYKGRLIFPWGYGVVLSNITREQLEKAQLDHAIPGDKVICQDEMKERVEAEEFQERLWRMFNYSFGTVLSLARIDRIRWHLFPEIRVDQGGLFAAAEAPDTQSPADVATPLAEVVPDLVRVMDREQEKFARNLGSGHRMIHGVAGSGKTLILAYRCLQLSGAEPGKPILVLCFNTALADRLRELLKARGVHDNVQVRHFHGWCREMCDLYQLDLAPAQGDNIHDRPVAAVIAGVDKGRVPRAQYSAILVDEGHDFEPEWFKLIVQMLDPDTDELLVVYDDVQSIYKRKRPKSWAGVGINVPGRRSTIFKMNYRNTAEVIDLAFRFVSEYLDDKAGSEDIPLVHPDAILRHGSRPTLRRYTTTTEETDAIATWFAESSARGIPFDRMAALCRYKDRVAQLSEALRRRGIPVAAPGTAGVNVMTMHVSKGLEFHSVVLPDLGAMPCKQVSGADDAKLLYVAMTRATDELLMTYHAESEFTKRLEGELAGN
jgi:hypothetical protein